MSDTSQVLRPPAGQAVALAGSGEPHTAWMDFFDSTSTQIAANTDAINAVHTGVTDGSNAAAGQVGEYLRADNFAGYGLVSGAPHDVVALALTAGDWDVSGNARFVATGTLTVVAAGVSRTSGTWDNFVHWLQGTLGTNSTQIIGTGGPVRVSVAAPATVYLVCSANFTGGIVASGSIFARRAR